MRKDVRRVCTFPHYNEMIFPYTLRRRSAEYRYPAAAGGESHVHGLSGLDG